MSSANYDALDVLIERIASDMTEVQPSTDFRDRVMTGLSPAPPIRWSHGAAVIAIAAAIVLALSLPQMSPHIPAPSGPAPQLIAKSSSDGALAGPAVQPSKQKHQGRSSRPQPVSADELAWLSRSVSPLGTPPLVIEPIQPLRQSITPISVEPLSSRPIELAPLEVRSSGRQ